MNKIKSLLAALLLAAGSVSAQTADPTIMTINGQPVPRSEFEYSYNKNNAETVVDKKSVADYVDLFVNYKLKVMAAQAEGLDTTKAFRDEYLMYRNQQVRPSFIDDGDVEREARKIYKQTQERVDGNGGLVHAYHILVALQQKASQASQDSAKLRADSIYTALKKGADFEDLARRCSDDHMSGMRGGDLSWVQKGQTVKEFEQKIFEMKKGETSEPFLSPFGYHIVYVKDRSNFFPYDSVRADIRRFIDQRGIREQIITQKIDSIAKADKVKPGDILDKRVEEMTANDPALKNLIREYHDGLLLYEISNRTVWNRAAKDDKALEAYFKKNRKKYRWDEPRFKGIAYYVKDAADVENVKNAIKNIPFEAWADTLRKEFNDSTVRIKVVKGIFKKGDNTLVDNEIFQTGAEVKPVEGYPITAVYGEKLKAPKTYKDVRELVVADYQEELEKKWVADLRKKYSVSVDKAVLETVNKH